MAEPLAVYLNEPGQVPGIGSERGERPLGNGIGKYTSRHGSTRYVRYIDGDPVSALQVVSRDGKLATIANVYTSPEHRRSGLAQALLNRARRDFTEVRHAADAHLSEEGRAWREGDTGTVGGMRDWWLWRLKPAPKKRLGTVLRLPWSYLAEETLDDGETAHQLSADPVRSGRTGSVANALLWLEKGLTAAKVPTTGNVQDAPIGAMRTLKINTVVTTGLRMNRRTYWLTPPVYQFADLEKHFDSTHLRDLMGPSYSRTPPHTYTYWINPEVFETTGEFLSGSLDSLHRVVNRRETQWMAEQPDEDNEIANFLLVALDSFLEHGTGDPRFNPR